MRLTTFGSVLNAHGCAKCRFCGELDHVEVVQEIISAGCSPDWFVRCHACGCHGPWAVKMRAAIEFWNDGPSVVAHSPE
jgi:hypothetical protein